MATVTMDLDEFLALVDPIADQEPNQYSAAPGRMRVEIDCYDLRRIRRMRDLCRQAKISGESWVNIMGDAVTSGPHDQDCNPVGL